ncbi:hypothetical protein K7432_001302 [Basidiobolus ranarum]|uniref:Uncharacterized protein n=1 Tax=Basidiobolus ranarum TaxID=34480 RepID=A0ABR2X393_9FUNG
MSNDSSFEPLNREQRKVCWFARDEFYRHLDSRQVIDPEEESLNQDKEATKLKETFEEKCPSSWVRYFNDLRIRQAHMGVVHKTGNRLM